MDAGTDIAGGGVPPLTVALNGFDQRGFPLELFDGYEADPVLERVGLSLCFVPLVFNHGYCNDNTR